MSNRPNGLWETLSPPWQACLEETWQAYCDGNVPIGAVITDKEENILAHGRNQRRGQASRGNALGGHPLAHAELNALIALDYTAVDVHTCTLYTATEPCPLCLGAVYMSGVRQLRFASRDPYAGSTNLLGTTPYLSHKPIQVFGPERMDLELALMALYVDYALQEYGDNANIVFERWSAEVPASIRLGRRLAECGEARRMRAERITAATAFDQLIHFLMG